MAFHELFRDYTFLVVLSGTIILGLLCGAIGSFIVLRKESLMGDCVAHASFPGIVGSFLLLQVKTLPGQLLGAAISALIAVSFIVWIRRTTKLPIDGVLAAILSGFFGFGIVLMTIVQRMDNANQSGLTTFIFGQASTMLYSDVVFMSTLGSILLLIILLIWKPLSAITFDEGHAEALGLPVTFFLYIMSIMTVLTVLLSIHTVGIILMSAFLIGPAVAARQWSRHLSTMVILAAIIGCISAIGGTIVSTMISKMPTGPAIVLFITAFVGISVLFSPTRGLLRRKN